MPDKRANIERKSHCSFFESFGLFAHNDWRYAHPMPNPPGQSLNQLPDYPITQLPDSPPPYPSFVFLFEHVCGMEIEGRSRASAGAAKFGVAAVTDRQIFQPT